MVIECALFGQGLPNIPLNMALWLDAAKLVTTSDGTHVTGWGSRVGTASAGAGNNPVLQAGALNGGPGIVCDGVDDWFQIGLPAGFPAVGTYYVVASGIDPAAQFKTVFSSHNQFRVQTNDFANAVAGGFDFALSGSAHVFELVWGNASANAVLYVDHSSVNLTSPAGGNPSDTLFLGRNGAPWNPDFAHVAYHEVIVYQSLHSDAERGRVYAYLHGRWGTP